MEEMKAAVLMALRKELPYFLMPEGYLPESAELRVSYDHSIATLRVGGKEILQMLEAAGRAGGGGAGKAAEERSDKEKADSSFGMPATGKDQAPVQP